MCGRYYVDDSLSRELQRDFPEINGDPGLRSGDVHPSEQAMILSGRDKYKLTMLPMRWGFPGKGKLLINARAESVREKKSFQKCIETRRCVIPASGFYEWDHNHSMVTFTGEKGQPLYLAGCFDLLENEQRFVILTREANESMAPVHDRMPLILSAEQVGLWIFDPKSTDTILRAQMPLLTCSQPYHQQSILEYFNT